VSYSLKTVQCVEESWTVTSTHEEGAGRERGRWEGREEGTEQQQGEVSKICSKAELGL